MEHKLTLSRNNFFLHKVEARVKFILRHFKVLQCFNCLIKEHLAHLGVLGSLSIFNIKNDLLMN